MRSIPIMYSSNSLTVLYALHGDAAFQHEMHTRPETSSCAYRRHGEFTRHTGVFSICPTLMQQKRLARCPRRRCFTLHTSHCSGLPHNVLKRPIISSLPYAIHTYECFDDDDDDAKRRRLRFVTASVQVCNNQHTPATRL